MGKIIRTEHLIKFSKKVKIGLVLIGLFFIPTATFSQIVGPYTGIDYATAYTNPSMGPPCDMTFFNAAIGDADFVNGAAEVPLGWSFSGTWNSGMSYVDGPGDELLLVSLHTYTESWYVALRLTDGSTTAFLPYNLTIVTTNATGTLAVCGGVSMGPYNYERPSQVLDFADYAIPPGVGVIGIVFEPFSDGAGNPDPHGVIVLEGTIIGGGCDNLITTAADTTLCVGEELTLEATSVSGAPVTWDGGVTNGVAFTPPVGTTTYNATTGDDADCEFSVTVVVNDLPTVTANVDNDEICDGESVIFTGGGAATYTWDMGVTDGVAFTPGALGTATYTVIGTDVNGCENTASVDVNVVETPTVTASVDDTSICLGESITFTSGGTAETYSWDMGVIDGTPFTPATAGTVTYTVTGTIGGLCTATASVNVTTNPIPAVTASSSSTDVCLGDNLTLTGGGAATYTWDSGVTNGVPFLTTTLGTFTYTVTGTSAAGCVNTASVTINVVDCEPIFAGFLMDNSVCIGDCITLTDTSSGGTIVSWAWDFGGAAIPTTSTEQNPTICLNTPGIYDIELVITSPFGETSTANKTLTVNELPTISVQLDTIIDIGGAANLIATSVSTGDYSWEPEQSVECPDCGITTASPIDSTVYHVHFIDQNGCSADGNVLVLVNFIEGVGVPTAFSPNGDGVNDVLFVKGYGLAGVNLVVYNRYGEVVFETTDQNIGWDGTFKNRDENPGVFTWVLQYDFVTGKRGMQKGNTTLIR